MQVFDKLDHGGRPRVLNAVTLLPVALAIAAIGYCRTRHLDAFAAISGFSPEQLALAANHPDSLAGDFPSGVLDNLNSIVFHIYPLAGRVGLDITSVWAVMIYLEVALFACAAIYVTGRLFPTADWPLRALVGIVFAGSTLLTPDMARLKFPYYGWVYAFAYACFLVALSEILRKRYVTAALLLSVQFSIHPITASFSGVFLAAVFLTRLMQGERPRLVQIATAGVVAAIGCGLWLAWIAGRSTVSGGDIDPATFIALNRAQNMHWFPSYLALYWERHWEELFPLLSSLALVAWAFGTQTFLPATLARQLAIGIGTLMGLCVAGLLASEFATWPPIVKVALHRADTTAILVGFLVVLPVLYRDLIDGDSIERGLAAVLILLPFYSDSGMLPFPVALRVGYAAVNAARHRTLSVGLGLAIALVGSIGLLLVIYVVAGQAPRLMVFRYIGLNHVLVAAGVAAALLPICWRGLDGRAALLVVTGIAVFTSPRFDPLANPAQRDLAFQALDAQLWARANTPMGSIFMVDPALDYFWRDKSHRPSFGTPREWLLISVLYNSRRSLLDEGLRRYEALGLRPPTFIHDPKQRRTDPMLARIVGEASDRFYAMSRTEIEKLSRTYDIRYFVYQKSKLKEATPLSPVYQNRHFLVTSAR